MYNTHTLLTFWQPPTLDVEDALHRNVVDFLLAQFAPDANNLIVVGGHHTDAIVANVPPLLWPFLTQLLHTVYNLVHLKRHCRSEHICRVSHIVV